MKELTGLMPGCKKTFSRDIALLKRAGIPIRYSVQRQEFVLHGDYTAPEYPSGERARIYLDKIIRLTAMMDEMPEVDCDQWYKGEYPGVSQRTMQRDFATLNAIGYRIKYERESYSDDVPPRHYYCDRPESAYSLTTFREG